MTGSESTAAGTGSLIRSSVPLNPPLERTAVQALPTVTRRLRRRRGPRRPPPHHRRGRHRLRRLARRRRGRRPRRRPPPRRRPRRDRRGRPDPRPRRPRRAPPDYSRRKFQRRELLLMVVVGRDYSKAIFVSTRFSEAELRRARGGTAGFERTAGGRRAPSRGWRRPTDLSAQSPVHNGLTSIRPKRAMGCFDAISMASSSPAHSSKSNPAIHSFVSAKGPSVMRRRLPRTRTVFAVARPARRWPMIRRPLLSLVETHSSMLSKAGSKDSPAGSAQTNMM